MVIQRWQSLLLLVATVMMVCFTFASLGQVQTEQYSFDFTSLGFQYEGESTNEAPEHTYLSTWYFFILSLTTSIIYLIDIFLYKNLPLQKRVCLIGVLMNIAAIFTGACLGYTAIDGYTVSWSFNIICPFLSIAGAIMALNCMQRDHNKLRAIDRIR